MTNVLVSLVNFNGNKNTLSCLDSLNEVVVQDFKLGVVVVDNASQDGSVEKSRFRVVVRTSR